MRGSCLIISLGSSQEGLDLGKEAINRTRYNERIKMTTDTWCRRLAVIKLAEHVFKFRIHYGYLLLDPVYDSICRAVPDLFIFLFFISLLIILDLKLILFSGMAFDEKGQTIYIRNFFWPLLLKKKEI